VPAGEEITIRELSRRTGLAAATLRAWETRHGFPVPRRLPSGHRRYRDADAEALREVIRGRERGLSLPAAIRSARAAAGEGERSIFASLRRRRPGLATHLLPRRTLLAVTHAIEDECSARADRAVLFGSFQAERFYRQAEPRWRALSRGARMAVALAPFDASSAPDGGPLEARFAPDDPLVREWVVVCDGPAYTACLAARERPEAPVEADERRFETLWTVDPRAVREAARIAAAVAARSIPERIEEISDWLSEAPQAPRVEDLERVTALAGRMIAYVGGVGDRSPAPARR
jgi:MerR family transcriptional regulator, light-induced transcriptional regulator